MSNIFRLPYTFNSHLTQDTSQSSQIIYRNGHISAASDAIDALIASFDDEEVDDEDLPEHIHVSHIYNSINE